MTNKTIQEQNIELEEYDRKFDEIKDITSKTKQKYVPELCEILRKLDPTLIGKQIGDKVKEDCEERLGWNWDTVQSYLPDFALNEKASQSAKRRYQNQNKDKLDKISKIFRNLESIELPPPPEPKPKDLSEETDQQMHELGIAKFGNTDKNLRELYGDITSSSAALFEALTQRNDMPDESDDLVVDYIKPTREFRRSLALEFDETQRTTLHNWLHYTSVVIEDMIEQIKDVENK